MTQPSAPILTPVVGIPATITTRTGLRGQATFDSPYLGGPVGAGVGSVPFEWDATNNRWKNSNTNAELQLPLARGDVLAAAKPQGWLYIDLTWTDEAGRRQSEQLRFRPAAGEDGKLDLTRDQDPEAYTTTASLQALTADAEQAAAAANTAAGRVTDAILDLEAERQAVADIIADTAQSEAQLLAAAGRIPWAGGDHTTLPSGAGDYLITRGAEAGQVWTRATNDATPTRSDKLESLSMAALIADTVASIGLSAGTADGQARLHKGRTYYWDSQDVRAADGGSIIAPAGNPAMGRWVAADREYGLDVRWYGAVEGGQVNCTASFQAALNAAAATSHGRVFVPSGRWAVASIKLPSGVTLTGLGSERTVLVLPNGANTNVIELALNGNAIDWSIKNLRVDGNKGNNTAGNGIYLFRAASGATFTDTNGLIENVRVYNCAENGIYAFGAGTATSPEGKTEYWNIRALTIRDVICRFNKGKGLCLRILTDSHLENIIASSNQQQGFWINYGGNLRLVSCKAFFNNQDSVASGPATADMEFFSVGRSQLIGCEVQEGFRNGFRFENCFNISGTVLADSNGRITAEYAAFAPAVGVVLKNNKRLTLNITGDSYHTPSYQAYSVSFEAMDSSNIITVTSTNQVSGDYQTVGSANNLAFRLNGGVVTLGTGVNPLGSTAQVRQDSTSAFSKALLEWYHAGVAQSAQQRVQAFLQRESGGTGSWYLRVDHGDSTFDDVLTINLASLVSTFNYAVQVRNGRNFSLLGANGRATNLFMVDGGNDAQMYIDPLPAATGTAQVRLFRNSNGGSLAQLLLYKGDGSATINSLVSGRGDAYLNADTGNLGVGTAAPTEKFHVQGGRIMVSSADATQYSQAAIRLNHAAPASTQRNMLLILQNQGAAAGGAASLYLRHDRGDSTFRNVLDYDLSAERLTVGAPLSLGDVLRLKQQLKANLPSASTSGAGAVAYISDPAAGKGRIVVSDGAAWRYAGDDTTV